jgi:hypothetical protein
MWNVISYSSGILLKGLKEIAKETTIRAGCQIRIENAISERELSFAVRIILMSIYNNTQRESNFDA